MKLFLPKSTETKLTTWHIFTFRSLQLIELSTILGITIYIFILIKTTTKLNYIVLKVEAQKKYVVGCENGWRWCKTGGGGIKMGSSIKTGSGSDENRWLVVKTGGWWYKNGRWYKNGWWW